MINRDNSRIVLFLVALHTIHRRGSVFPPIHRRHSKGAGKSSVFLGISVIRSTHEIMARNRGTSLVSSSLALLLIALTVSSSHGFLGTEKKIKSAVFLSPKLEMNPGSVANLSFDMDFPRGHIGVKSFDAEVVDEAGNSVPLHETYLHHWVSSRTTCVKASTFPSETCLGTTGLCKNTLRHFFGLGSETRKTSTYVPDPYAIEFDNPEERPDGYEFKWLLNIHAIDTRGVVDKSGCTECRCDLYNVTIDEYGRTIKPDYKGGLYCCYDKTQCLVEYDVKPCKTNGDGCVDVKKKSLMMPFNGYVVYGVAHQHSGGVGASLSREGGEGICTSRPKYGNGVEPGNEAGYIVGMSTCYPQEPVKVSYGETLTLEFNYSSAVGHTGVMGLFYILVAQQLPEPEISLPALFQAQTKSVSFFAFLAVTVVVVVAVVVLIAAVVYRRQNREDGYQSLST
ncbi:unnamed protein product [Microthlaspi erraticum]|uniref:Uncharacterized protein n=1 Tax=Microthlaspi erraticum TaxID=1685480 RepID=A0A6D2JDN1_9BRAS|nr:unnamed protein product [Microthlaspi erraticum]